MVQAKSTATVKYDDGCTVPIAAGNMVMVSRNSPCKVKASCTAPAARECSTEGGYGTDDQAAPFIIGALGISLVAFIAGQGIEDTTTKNPSFISP